MDKLKFKVTILNHISVNRAKQNHQYKWLNLK